MIATAAVQGMAEDWQKYKYEVLSIISLDVLIYFVVNSACFCEKMAV